MSLKPRESKRAGWPHSTFPERQTCLAATSSARDIEGQGTVGMAVLRARKWSGTWAIAIDDALDQCRTIVSICVSSICTGRCFNKKQSTKDTQKPVFKGQHHGIRPVSSWDATCCRRCTPFWPSRMREPQPRDSLGFGWCLEDSEDVQKMWIIVSTSKRSHDNQQLQHRPVPVERGDMWRWKIPRPQLNFQWFSSSMEWPLWKSERRPCHKRCRKTSRHREPLRWSCDGQTWSSSPAIQCFC